MRNEALILDAVRTPIGKYGGILAKVRPDDLAATAIRGLLGRVSGLDPAEIEDVYMGSTNQAGEDNRNVARMAALIAGLPVSVAGVTVNRVCGSGLEAVNQAARAVWSGEGELFVAGGVESMSRAPLVMPKAETAFARNAEIYDTTIGWRFVNPYMRSNGYDISLGETAEVVAERWLVSREDQDLFALTSQQRAGQAIAAGRFADELIPVAIPQKKGDPVVVTADEHPRPGVTLEQLAKLPPVFKKGGTVTAGNASGVNDGAAAVLIASERMAKALGARPIARVLTTAVAGVDPTCMGVGPIPAVRKALQRAGLAGADMDVVELNEAFASQSVACVRELGLNPERVNVNGGAIALGHPLGCSGARILTTLAHELRRREGRYGLASMCIGVGQGIATIIERL